MHIALLAPMRSELRPLVARLGLRRGDGTGPTYEGRLDGARVTATVAGVGTARAAAAARRVLDGGAVDHVLVVGLAGGLDDHLAVADVVVPDVVIDAATGARHRPAPLTGMASSVAAATGALRTSDAVVLDPALVPALRAAGVVALDMETAAVAAVCEDRGCPWSVVRSISDRWSEGRVDAELAALVGPDGTPDLGAVARFVVRRPGRLGDLVRLGRDGRAAARVAAAAAVVACRRLVADAAERG